MPVCAVVDATTFKVTNTIVATPSDAAPDGSYLISIPQGVSVDNTYVFAGGIGYMSPHLQLFYVFNNGVAVPRTLPEAQQICQNDLNTQYEALKNAPYIPNPPTPDSIKYLADLSAQNSALETEIGTLNFQQCTVWQPHDWPPIPPSFFEQPSQ
jgi:hypothetical protein